MSLDVYTHVVLPDEALPETLGALPVWSPCGFDER
jgi:hypothetical protein